MAGSPYSVGTIRDSPRLSSIRALTIMSLMDPIFRSLGKVSGQGAADL